MKKLGIGLGIFLIILILGLTFAGNYFYNYAFVPAKKDFLADEPAVDSGKVDPAKDWFTGDTRTNWHITSKDGLKLRGIYVPAAKNTGKTAVIAHGYMGKAEDMYQFARMYHELGYNVLVPDARGHGESQGKYIGFGWPERKDYVQWIDEVLKKNGSDEEITLYGISMGAATVMFTSGEDLPKNVVSIVEDCGYDSIENELIYQYHQLFDLPTVPLMQVTEIVTRVRAGFWFSEGDATKQLAKNKLPMFFIHGEADDFVPFSMLDKVYHATNGPKVKWEVPGAKHAKSYDKDPAEYQRKVADFLGDYPLKD